MGLCVVAGITHDICCSWDYISDYVLLQGLSMGCFVACITHEMCCNRSYPLNYVLLQGLSMGLCVVAGIIHGDMCCCRDYR